MTADCEPAFFRSCQGMLDGSKANKGAYFRIFDVRSPLNYRLWVPIRTISSRRLGKYQQHQILWRNLEKYFKIIIKNPFWQGTPRQLRVRPAETITAADLVHTIST